MKEHLKETIDSFFIITTLICIAMFILGGIFRPDQSFGYEAYIYPVIYSAAASIPGLIMYTKKEMSISQMIIRKILQLIILVAVILILVFGGSPLTGELVGTAAGVAASVVVIFVAVHIIKWFLDSKTARQMMNDLEGWKLRTEALSHE